MLQIAETQQKSFSGELAERFRSLRKLKGYSLADVAKLCNTTPQTIQRIETNKMTISTEWIEAICKALGENPRTLFYEVGNYQDKYYNLLNEFTRLHCEIQILKDGADRLAERVKTNGY